MSNYNSRLSQSHAQTSFYRSHKYRKHKEERSSQYKSTNLSAPKVSEVELSKELVRILRHGKYRWLYMDYDGYIRVQDILSDRKFRYLFEDITEEDIIQLVESNDKQRFILNDYVDGFLYIKAAQGHTIPVQNSSLTEITDAHRYNHVFHGTNFYAWSSIQKSGLNRMKRNHIHFSIGLPNDQQVISGMRKGSDVVIELDLEKAMRGGLKFYASCNNVVLSEGNKEGSIHPKYFKRVFELRTEKPIDFDVPRDDENVCSEVDRDKKLKDHELQTNDSCDFATSSGHNNNYQGYPTKTLPESCKRRRRHYIINAERVVPPSTLPGGTGEISTSARSKKTHHGHELPTSPAVKRQYKDERHPSYDQAGPRKKRKKHR